MAYFGGLLSPNFPHTNSDADYSTFRLKYTYATSQFTASTIIGGTETVVATFSLTYPSAEFDRMRYRWEGGPAATAADSGWFLDSTVVCTDGECTVALLLGGGVALLLRRRRSVRS